MLSDFGVVVATLEVGRSSREVGSRGLMSGDVGALTVAVETSCLEPMTSSAAIASSDSNDTSLEVLSSASDRFRFLIGPLAILGSMTITVIVFRLRL